MLLLNTGWLTVASQALPIDANAVLGAVVAVSTVVRALVKGNTPTPPA